VNAGRLRPNPAEATFLLELLSTKLHAPQHSFESQEIPMAKRKNLGGGAKRRIKHGTCVKTGRCRDCAQGVIGESKQGFEYFDQDSDGRGFWFR